MWDISAVVTLFTVIACTSAEDVDHSPGLQSEYTKQLRNETKEAKCKLTFSIIGGKMSKQSLSGSNQMNNESFQLQVMLEDQVQIKLFLSGCHQVGSVTWFIPTQLRQGNSSRRLRAETKYFEEEKSFMPNERDIGEQICIAVAIKNSTTKYCFHLNILMPPLESTEPRMPPLVTLAPLEAGNTSIWSQGNIFESLQNKMKILNYSALIEHFTTWSKWKIAINFTKAFYVAPVLELLGFDDPYVRTVGYFLQDEVFISFVFRANPKPRIVWLLNQTAVEPGQVLDGKYEALQLVWVGPVQYRASLRVRAVAAEDAGLTLTLRARNSLGHRLYQRVLYVAPLDNITFQYLAYGLCCTTSILFIFVVFRIFVAILQYQAKKQLQVKESAQTTSNSVKRPNKHFRHLRLWLQYVLTRHYAILQIIHLLGGLTIGYLLYLQILKDRLPERVYELCFGWIVCIGLTYSFVKFVAFRCLVTLSLVTIAAKTFQSFVLMTVFSGIILGPGMNVLHSSQEIVASITCFLEQHVNMQVYAQIQLAVPIVGSVQALFTNDTSVKDLQELQANMNDVLQEMYTEFAGDQNQEKEVAKEVNDEADYKVNSPKRSEAIEAKYSNGSTRAKRLENQYNAKSQARCETIISTTVTQCVRAFKKSVGKCYEDLAFWIDWIVCPMMDYSQDCKKIRDGKGEGSRLKCSEITEGEKGFGDVADGIDQNSQLFNSSVGLAVAYAPNEEFDLNLDTVRKQTTKLKADADRSLSWLQRHLVILEYSVFISFFITILENIRYLDQYGQDINFDNIYVTHYFLKRDKRRKKMDKEALLPLKKIEERDLVTSLFMTRMTQEEQNVKNEQYFMISVLFLFLISVFVTDQQFYQMSVLFEKHAQIKYNLDLRFNHSTVVHGENVISNFLRRIVNNFDIELHDQQEYRTEKCFPKIRAPNYSMYGAVILQLFFAAIFSQWSPYFLRVRRAVCALFFPLQERGRVLHLYETLRRKRKGYLLLVKKKILKGFMEGRIGDLRQPAWWEHLRQRSRFLDAVLGALGFRHSCIVCGDVEDKALVVCPGPLCSLKYCSVCWTDCSDRCLNCTLRDFDQLSLDDITIALGVSLT